MLIVADNEQESKNLFMVENDVVLLVKIKIPVIMVSLQDSANFLVVFQNPAERVLISIDFPVIKSEVLVAVRNVLQVDDKRSYEYIQLYEEIYRDFTGYLSTNIIYKTATGTETLYGKFNCLQAQVNNQI